MTEHWYYDIACIAKDNFAAYLTQGGSGAVETAIKFVRKITGRTQIAAFHGAYHGVWCGCNSLTTGDQYRKDYGPFIISAGAEEIRTIGDVRGGGLMIGIEMVENKETREPLNSDAVGKIIGGMLNRGMLLVPCGRFGNVFRFMPPLVLTRDYAAKAVDILLEAARDVA